MASESGTGLQLRSLIKRSGELELSLAKVQVPEPGPEEVLVRVEAAPINPSDLGLLLGPADLTTARLSGTSSDPVIIVAVPGSAMKGAEGRLDKSMPSAMREPVLSLKLARRTRPRLCSARPSA